MCIHLNHYDIFFFYHGEIHNLADVEKKKIFRQKTQNDKKRGSRFQSRDMDNPSAFSYDCLKQVLDLLMAEERVRLGMCSPTMNIRVIMTRNECFQTNVPLLSGASTIPRWTTIINLAGHVVASTETIANLPTHLTSLSMPYVRSCDYDSSLFKWLPSTLTHLHLTSNEIFSYLQPPVGIIGKYYWTPCGANNQSEFYLEHSFQFLPRSLVHLRISGYQFFTSLCTKNLPPGLKILELPHDVSLTDKDILQLPSTLTHLNLRCNNILTNACVHNLPRELTHLDLSSNGQLNCDCIVHLPRSLTVLKLKSIRQHTAFLDLPPGLKRLQLQSYYGNMNDLDILFLPRTLTDLQTFAIGLSPVAFQNLPSKLTSLALQGDYNILPEDILHLPPCLTYLALTMNRTLNNDGVANLPRGLQRLYIDYNNIIDDFGIQLLPRGLLSLRMTTNDILTNSCIPHLPPALTMLEMPSNKHWTDSFISQLPSGLTRLNLESNKNLSDFCIPHLPRELTSLDLSLTSLSDDASIAKLPRKLKLLRLGNVVELSSKAIKDLPRGLTSLKLVADWHLMTSEAKKNLPPKLYTLALLTTRGGNNEYRAVVSNIRASLSSVIFCILGWVPMVALIYLVLRLI